MRAVSLRVRGALGAAVMAGALLLTACEGEDRPQVEVIGGAESVSISDLGPEPGFSNPSLGGNKYAVAAPVDQYFAMGADLRDIRTALDKSPSDWAAATAIFENGKNQTAGGSTRSLAAISNDEIRGVFPNGAAVYGRPDFINGLVRDGLAGTGKAAGLPDDARRKLVENGIQMLMYGNAMQEFNAAKARMESGAGNAVGSVDEAWATLAGPKQGAIYPYALLHTADEREIEFRLQNMLILPLESVMIIAQQAAQKGEVLAFSQSYPEAVGYINGIFYLSTLRAASNAERATDTNARRVAITDGWSYWQTIRALVTNASPSAAQTIEDAFNRNPAEAFSRANTTAVYAALNEPAVMRALGIPAAITVRTPPE